MAVIVLRLALAMYNDKNLSFLNIVSDALVHSEAGCKIADPMILGRRTVETSSKERADKWEYFI